MKISLMTLHTKQLQLFYQKGPYLTRRHNVLALEWTGLELRHQTVKVVPQSEIIGELGKI